MTKCNHNWKSHLLTGSEYKCTECGTLGNGKYRYDSKLGTEKYTIRALRRK